MAQANYGNVKAGCLLFGIPIFVLTAIATPSAIMSTGWPSVPGIISQSEFSNSSSASGKIRLNAAYSVNGASYSCDRVEFGGGPQRRDVYRYLQNTQVRVYYKPSDPTQCVLEPGISFSLAVMWAVSLGMLSIAAFANGRMKIDIDSSQPLKTTQRSPENGSLADVDNLIAQDRTVEAIALYRKLTGAGLKDAKDHIDMMQKNKSL